jgi:hypothetical protein
MTYQLTAESVDDHLGPRTGRYFGEGFKRVNHRLTAVDVDPAERAGRVEAKVGLEYPTDWSKKATGSLRPHLSSIDALLIAAQLCEMYLLHSYSLTPAQRQRMWLRHVDIRAGSAPQEELEDLSIRAVNTSRRIAAVGICSTVSTFSCVVGALRVTCEVEHDINRPLFHPLHLQTADDLLGDPDSRHFGNAYKARTQFIRAVDVAPEAGHVEALVAVTSGETPDESSHAADQGLGGRYQPSLSMVDGLLVLAQLAQVVAYRMDGLSRANTNTMWMRRLTLNASTPFQPMRHPFVSSVNVEGANRLVIGDRVWRTVDAAGHFLGIDARCAFAHQLPAPPIARPGNLRSVTSCTTELERS